MRLLLVCVVLCVGYRHAKKFGAMLHTATSDYARATHAQRTRNAPTLPRGGDGQKGTGSAEEAEAAADELGLLDERGLHVAGHAKVVAEVADDPAGGVCGRRRVARARSIPTAPDRRRPGCQFLDGPRQWPRRLRRPRTSAARRQFLIRTSTARHASSLLVVSARMRGCLTRSGRR